MLFSKEPPAEVAHLVPARGAGSEEASVNYITFVLFPNHYSTEEKTERSMSLILSFRDYFHYHIKCCKAYLHNRMRSKVGLFLKVLNRSKASSAPPGDGS